ncbi:MAG: anti-sigma factor antagonist [Acidobacteria bacterium]|nr:MAG: anti-sigma factor antagonist [Acidobacteriota bacterium]
MDFKLSTRRADGVFIVDLAGRITAGDAVAAFRQAIRDEVANGHHKILLNLKDVSYIDSSGLGELIMAIGTVTQTICTSCGATVFKDEDGNWDPCPQCESKERKTWGQMKLSNPGRQVTDLLQFTKLYTVFDVHESEQEALASFSTPG